MAEKPNPLTILRNLLVFAEQKVCLHENTYRGGGIWEICYDCDKKWADDRGGKPSDAHEWPKEIVAAQEYLESIGNACGIFLPQVELELPDGETRTLKQIFREDKGDKIHLCVSIKEPTEEKEKPNDLIRAINDLNNSLNQFKKSLEQKS